MTRNDLTQEQVAKLVGLALFWQREADRTTRANRPRAEAAIDEIYALVGRPAPEKHWVSSPVSALINVGEDICRSLAFEFSRWLYVSTTIMADKAGFDVKALIVDRMTRFMIPVEPWTEEDDERHAGMRRRPPSWHLRQLSQHITDRIDLISGVYGWPITLEDAFMRGALDPFEIYVADAFAAILELPAAAPLTAYSMLARSAGFVLPLEKDVWLCERPTVLNRDRDGNLHSSDGPAVDWAGTMPLYFWHGERVKGRAVEPIDNLSARDILYEPHRTTRDIMLQRFGLERFLRDVGHSLRSDETGTLWRAGSVFAVEVENGTPEPDGSFRRYFLRVPSSMQSAREAVAWTYGLSKRDYKVAVRT